MQTLWTKAENLHIGVGGAIWKTRRVCSKEFRNNKSIMKMEHMKRLYEDRHREPNGTFMNSYDTCQKGQTIYCTRRRTQASIRSKFWKWEKRKLIRWERALSSTSHGQNSPDCRALELIKQKTKALRDKLDAVGEKNVATLKEKSSIERSELNADVENLDREYLRKKRVEEASARYTEVMVELSQNQTTRLLTSWSNKFSTMGTSTTIRALREILRQMEREKRRGKLTKEHNPPQGKTLVSEDDQSLPYATVQPHWLLGGAFQTKK